MKVHAHILTNFIQINHVFFLAGNWSDGLREILRCCYEHHGLNPETFIQEDPQDSHEDTLLPEELRPSPHPQIHLQVGSCQIFDAG